MTPLAATAIDALVAMFPTNVTLKRKSGGSYVDGRWVDGAGEPDEKLFGSVQHAKGDEIDRLPEQLRRHDMRVFWTRSDLRIHTTEERGDQLVYNDLTYDVIKVNERFEGGYHRALIGRNNVRTNSI